MIDRITKFAVGIANIYLIWLTWNFFWGKLDWNLAFGAVAISGFWLVLTAVRLRSLLQTYFDVFSRLRVRVPLVTGVICSVVALTATTSTTLLVIAGAELVAWLGVYLAYRYNRRQFEKVGAGPLPDGAWVNPPGEALPNLALVLTGGNIANTIHESVGHGEVVINMPDGSRKAFSSYMQWGVVLRDLETLTKPKRGIYIALRLRDGVTDEQAARAVRLVTELKECNEKWRDAANARRLAIIDRLWLPASWRKWLAGKTKITGYDWPGLLIGTRSSVRWTCIGVCLELYQRLGIKTKRYGTGLLGLGIGLLNPIKPVRFLDDPAFVLLTEADREAFERTQRKQ